ncbi:TonB-dependent receptor domain-containing protein [Methylocystis echinoides]|uniref:TonB-dependent receptor plug domain-containing protein n=1 Tax=Methylocystis echinoides TaxID=29468 RepID=UPI00342D7057
MLQARLLTCSAIVLGVGRLAVSEAVAQTKLPDLYVSASRPTPVRATTAQPPQPVQETAPISRPSIVDEQKIEVLRVQSEDATKLLERTPGVTMYEAGGVSRLPVIQGLADDRVKILTGGVSITSACANHMNPPLSYTGSNNVEKIEVYSGVVPVSKGGDSIGGTIIAEPKSPVFLARSPGASEEKQVGGTMAPLFQAGKWAHGSDVNMLASGEISSAYRSNNVGISTSATVNEAMDRFAFLYNGSWARGRNYNAGGNNAEAFSTDFISENHSGTLAYRADGHLASLRVAYENIPYQGFVNQRMDMIGNRGYLAEAKYNGTIDWGVVDARLYWNSTAHKMGFLQDKQPNNMPMDTTGLDYGYSINLDHRIDERLLLRVGSEFHGFRLNDWWEPIPGGGVMTMLDNTTFMAPFPDIYSMKMLMMTPFTQWNIQNGMRNRWSHYAEVETNWSPQLETLFGVRSDLVFSNVDAAQAYDPNNPTIMPMLTSGNLWRPGEMQNPDATAAALFNQQDRRRFDPNFNITAQFRYKPTENTAFEAGYARKTRSPNLYERYSWGVSSMTTAMINQFGDGNGYVGNLALQPEVAHTVSVSGAFKDKERGIEAKIAPYFSFVNNFINAQRVSSFRFGGYYNAGPYTFQELQFVNHRAIIYGVDANGRAKLYEEDSLGRFDLTALVSYTYGVDLDVAIRRIASRPRGRMSPCRTITRIRNATF